MKKVSFETSKVKSNQIEIIAVIIQILHVVCDLKLEIIHNLKVCFTEKLVPSKAPILFIISFGNNELESVIFILINTCMEYSFIMYLDKNI